MLEPVIEEYFAVLGFNLPDIAALPPEQIWERTSGHRHAGDNIKRLADALELRAKLCTDMEPDQLIYRFSALNLYEMVGAIDSQIRVGQDLADDMSARGRFDEAKQVIERLLLPLLAEHGMVDQAIGVRSQYAVFLAYCEEFDAADAEMTRLMPYSAGFTRRQRQEIQEQLKIIHNCKVRYVCRVEEYSRPLWRMDRRIVLAAPEKPFRNVMAASLDRFVYDRRERHISSATGECRSRSG